MMKKIFSITNKILSMAQKSVKIERRANLHGIKMMSIAFDYILRDRKDLLSLRKDLFAY